MVHRNGFSHSNEISNNSSTCCVVAATNSQTLASSEALNTPDFAALQLLFTNLESIFESTDSDSFYSDAKIALSSGHEVPVRRCILSARSSVFKTVFSGLKERGAKFELKELARDHEIGYDSLVAVLTYLSTGRVKPLPKGVRVCVDNDCLHVACRPAVEFMAERLQEKCVETVVKSDVDIVTLDKALPDHLVEEIIDSRQELGLDKPENSGFPDKHVKRIHRALDSDDVELVMLNFQ